MTHLDTHQLVGIYVVIGLLLLWCGFVPMLRGRVSARSNPTPAPKVGLLRQLVIFAGLAFLAVGLRALAKGY